MSQRKISSFFSSKPKENVREDRSEVEVRQDIKEEPEVEFVCVLPPLDQDRTLLGILKVKTEQNIATEKINSIFQSTHVKCRFCLKEVSKKAIKAHLSHHRKKNRGAKHECKICEKKLFSTSALSAHLKKHEGRYLCKLCNQKLQGNRSYKDHLKFHEDSNAFKCDICQELFEESLKLNQHLRKDHIDKIYKCRHCSKNHKLKHSMIMNVSQKLCACK